MKRCSRHSFMFINVLVFRHPLNSFCWMGKHGCHVNSTEFQPSNACCTPILHPPPGKPVLTNKVLSIEDVWARIDSHDANPQRKLCLSQSSCIPHLLQMEHSPHKVVASIKESQSTGTLLCWHPFTMVYVAAKQLQKNDFAGFHKWFPTSGAPPISYEEVFA